MGAIMVLMERLQYSDITEVEAVERCPLGVPNVIQVKESPREADRGQTLYRHDGMPLEEREHVARLVNQILKYRE